MSRNSQSQKKITGNKAKPSFKQWLLKHKVWIIILIILILVDTFITGYAKFAYNVVRCGGMPIVANSNLTFGGLNGYIYPGDSGYKAMAGSRYYCSQESAEAAGIRPSILTEKGPKRMQELKDQGNWPPQQKN